MNRAQAAENEYTEMYIENGILFGKFKDGVYIDLPEAIMVVELRHELQNNRKMPLLFDIRGLKGWSKTGRDYFASEYSIHNIAAGALLTDKSLFTLTLGNMFFRISRPNVPHKLFSNRDKAVVWLKKFLISPKRPDRA